MSAGLDPLRARWQAMDDPTRAAITELIAEAVLAELRTDPWYSSFSSPARVEVLGASERDATLRVHFVADHLNYCYAQSGSDWANHDLLGGELALVDGSPTSVRVERIRRVNVTERDWDEGYDREPAFASLRAQQLARLLAAAPSEAST